MAGHPRERHVRKGPSHVKADRIFTNAKIFTADSDTTIASALAVKDGTFVYVGDEQGLADFEGEVEDLGGRFIMPSIIDSHVHITTGIGFEYADLGAFIDREDKSDILAFMADYVRDNPGMGPYRFMLERVRLCGEELVKEELDAICPEVGVVVL